MSEVEKARKPRLPRRRPADPDMKPGMRLTDLDVQVMVDIWKREGVVTIGQLMTIRGVQKSAIYRQMTRLYHNEYVGRVDETNRDRAIREGVYWLRAKGALVVASTLFGKEDLSDFSYRKEPKWQTLNHDLRLNDIRIRVEQDTAQLPGGVLHEWVSDYEFHQLPDVVKVKQILGRGDRGAVKRDREIMPDGYFSFSLLLPGKEQRHRYRYLLELDLATETRKGQFGKDKVIPLTTYIDSEVYAERFGAAGRVLVVTTSQARLNNLRAQAVEYNDMGYFLFTTLDEVDAAANILFDPIWVSARDEQPRALVSG